MKKILGSALVLNVLLALSLSPAHAMAKKPPVSIDNFLISGDVPAEQLQLLTKDIELLKNLNHVSEDPELVRIMKLSQANGPEMKAWLEARVRFIVGRAFDVRKAVTVIQENYAYQNDILPITETARKRVNTNSEDAQKKKKVFTVMSNMGSNIYITGKMNHALLGLTFPQLGVVPVTSPRTGIIQVGEGLFMPLEWRTDGTVVDSQANSLMRLQVFFHEARHSDGNGATLGFLHALCPEGHDFAGRNACDRNLNGPYTVGALVGRAFKELCTDCSVEEEEVLRLTYLDSFNRVIRVTKAGANPSGESKADQLDKELCRLYDRHPDVFARQIAECQARFGSNAPIVRSSTEILSTEWDDAPEGQR